MNKNKELAKNTVIISIGKICTQFINFMLLPLYTSMLSTNDYGIVDLLLTYVQLLFPIVSIQIDQAIFRFLIEKRNKNNDFKKIISSALIFVIFNLVVFSVIFSVAQCFFTSEYIWLFFINVISIILSNVMLQVARGIGDNVSYAMGSFLAGSIAVVLNVLFIAFFNMGITGMLLATCISNIICSVYIFIKNKVYEYFEIEMFSIDSVKEMIKYSIPLVPNALSWWIVNASDRTIVSFFLGTSANGILSVAHKFPTIITTVYGVFNMAWTESAALHLKEKDGSEFFSKIISTVFRLFSSLCIGIIAIMPFAFSVLVDDKYADSYKQIPIYIISALFNIIVGLYSVVYISNKMTKEIAKTSIFAGVINILVNLLLIKKIGLYAASVSSAIAYMAMAIYRHIDLKKYVKLKINYGVFVGTFFVIGIESICYYSEQVIAFYFGLLIGLVYCLTVNWNFIKKTIEELIIKIKR